jgi:hypothetical protein
MVVYPAGTRARVGDEGARSIGRPMNTGKDDGLLALGLFVAIMIALFIAGGGGKDDRK